MLPTFPLAAIRWRAEVAYELGLDSLIGAAVDLLALGVVAFSLAQAWGRSPE